MNQNGISNIYIDQLMNKISWSFRGTFSANNIPKFKDNFFSLIVNLSNEGETGTHFIAIFITENKILYFDSLGSFQINPNIKHYLETYKNQFHTTKNKYNIYLALIVDSFVLHL